MKLLINVNQSDAFDCIWLELMHKGIDSVKNNKMFLDAIRNRYNGCTEEVACYDTMSKTLTDKTQELIDKYYRW